MRKKPTLYVLSALIVLMAAASCSSKKNTSLTRFYHGFTAHYNTYFNGHQAYLEGLEAQEKSHQDDYGTLLPMFTPVNKATQGTGKGSYATAIEKCEKAIKRHSIKRRPARNTSRRLTEAEKLYYARKEFNPFLHNAWMLMGKSQFQQGEFIEAASTFNYIIRLYATQPEIVSEARAYLARCYVALEWPYDAEDVFGKIKRDSMGRRGAIEHNASYASYLILTQQYKEAIPYLRQTIRKEKRKPQRARLNFLLGQLYREVGEHKESYKALRRVVRANPPYVLALNARVLQSEVSSKGQSKKMIRRLQRMAKSDKNKDYLDQVYYAIGNIYLSVKDTTHCIGAYETGVEKSTQNGPAKANLLLRLGNLYWEWEEYVEAQRCYAEAVGLLDKEHDAYDETERRSKILDELAPHIAAVELQDSLQALARMPEAERMAAIDRVIEALKKKEKEEEKKLRAQGLSPGGGSAGAGGMGMAQNNAGVNRGQDALASAAGDRKGAWYFYNPQVVMQGKREFERRWGKRPNEDNWRRSDKQTVQGMGEFEAYDYDVDTDSLEAARAEADALAAEAEAAAEQARLDSLANDPHSREYYLKQIPFEEDQLEASHQVLSDGLYNSGMLEAEKLENFPLAERTLLRLITEYPDYGERDKALYHLFLLSGRKGRPEEAAGYRQQLMECCPESKYAVLLSNPNYERNARFGKHLEDSLYAATYAAYQASRYDEVAHNFQLSSVDFPEGIHRAKFLFIRAMSQLYEGRRDSFLVNLKEVISKYPKNEITEMAKYIVKGMEEGRLLNDTKFDLTNLWGRRTQSGGTDSTATGNRLSAERNTNFVFMLAYPENSLDENQLLYEMARYNFTSFMVRNFDLEIVTSQGLSQLLIRGFLNFDEAHAYMQRLFSDPHMARVLEGIRVVVISEQNLPLLGTAVSYDDYKAFYDEHFAPLQIPEDLRLDEAPFLEQEDNERPKEEEETDGPPSDDELFEELFQ